MNYFCDSLWAIFAKDIVTEFRARQVLPTMVVLGMLIVWVLRIVSEAAMLSTTAMGAAVLWVAFLFSGLLAQERAFASEEHEDCISGLLLAPVDPGTIYIAKLLVNVVMLCVFEVIMVPIVMLTFQVSVGDRWLELLLILLLGNIGISSVGTLFSAMVQLSRTRGALLSILVLVILMPMMVPATFALLWVFGAVGREVTGTGALAVVGSFKASLGYMAAFDSVFAVTCWLLFGFVVQE